MIQRLRWPSITTTCLTLCIQGLKHCYNCYNCKYSDYNKKEKKRITSQLPNLNIFFSSEGSTLTPAHHYPDFRLKTYAPLAFRYFRELFGIKPDDYLVSVQNEHNIILIQHVVVDVSVHFNTDKQSTELFWISVLHVQWAPDRAVQPGRQQLLVLPHQRRWVHHQDGAT